MVSSGSERRPVIGVSAYSERAAWGVWDREAALLPQPYISMVHRSGGVPVLLPVLPDSEDAVLSAVDGLILAGGPDVDPASYGSSPHRTVNDTRPDRDDWEIRLLRAALAADLPVLGICRGAQVLNVALGGTLQQHLPETVGHDGHRPAPAVFGRAAVRLRAGSRLAGLLGEHVDVPCYHHQSLGTVAKGLDVAGHAGDATVEAVELPGRSFALGVQWHPEEDPDDLRLFTALARAAAPVCA